MATAFHIHEDIENILDNKHKKDIHKKNVNNFKADGKIEKQPLRSTFAVLNNVTDSVRNAATTTTHAQKLGKITVAKENDENAIPNSFNVKSVAETCKAFIHVENNVNQIDEYKDKNHQFSTRYPLQEIKQDIDSSVCMQDILSPMSVDKSLIDANVSLITVDQQADTSLPTTSNRTLTEYDTFFDVEEYREDILTYLREAELNHRPKPMYMRKQPDISHSMRTILVDWLVEVGEEYRLQNETLCLAVSYIDRFLSVMSVVRAKLQLVGTAAMFIAAKYEEIYPPDVGEFVYITDSTYTKKQVLRMEQLILKVLTFDLCVPTTCVFLNAYPTLTDLPNEVKCMAQYLCELSLLEAEPYLQYVPSMISAAAMALARLNFQFTIWSSELDNFTGYTIYKLTDLIIRLSESHVNAIHSPQQAIQEKYKSNKYSEVSTRTPLQVDEIVLTQAIQKLDYDADPDKEYNENVRKMISSLQFVS